jgi:predicted ABC-type ATPase
MELPTADATQRGHGDTALTHPPESLAQRDRQRWVDRLANLENPATARDALKARMHRLEPGHPSSPWNSDGTPRPPVPRLSDLDHPKPPLSDAEYSKHLRDVRQVLDGAAAKPPLWTEHTVDGKGEVWTPERNRIHGEIVAEAYKNSGDVPPRREAIIAGGLGGAGKTTVLEKYAGVDLSRYVVINPDNFKKELAERGLVAELPGLSPMESTTFYHEESSDIARRLAMRAIADGKNIIWDITMSSEESTLERIQQLRAAGYERIDGLFVDIPVETSVARSEARHRRGHDQYLSGNGLGGRYLPSELIREKANIEFGTVNREVFEKVKGHFNNWAIYDNSIDGQPPTLIDSKGQVGADTPLPRERDA